MTPSARASSEGGTVRPSAAEAPRAERSIREAASQAMGTRMTPPASSPGSKSTREAHERVAKESELEKA
jgi:hypothetical protein